MVFQEILLADTGMTEIICLTEAKDKYETP
jgi:hypothetical protein